MTVLLVIRLAPTRGSSLTAMAPFKSNALESVAGRRGGRSNTSTVGHADR